MPSLKEYKAKLASLKNTRKMTKTMKMVAASKLNKTMDAQRRASLFDAKLKEMIARLAASVDLSAHPLLQPRPHPKRALVLVVTSDKGMCAGFNNNLIKFVSRWLARPLKKYEAVEMSFCGRRGQLFFKSRNPVCKYYDGVTAKPSFDDAVRIATDLCQDFLSGKYDEVYVAYNHFISPLSQKPQLNQLLPIEPEDVPAGGKALHSNFILEPTEHELLSGLLPKTIAYEIYFALLENAAGENGARMTAMDNATSNADSMIDRYTLLRNRARQASITKELIEIISGAEALKG